MRVENNCQNCGYQQVRINGLDGPYTQILIDSRPIFSALAGVYGLEQIPANMIERVEVMRGGGSALFGSSAIAGTINIITKEPVRNSAQFSHTLTGIGDASVFENNTTMNASLVSDNQKLGLAVFGQNRERAGYDHDGDGFTELPELKSQTVGMRSYIKTRDYSKVTGRVSPPAGAPSWWRPAGSPAARGADSRATEAQHQYRRGKVRPVFAR